MIISFSLSNYKLFKGKHTFEFIDLDQVVINPINKTLIIGKHSSGKSTLVGAIRAFFSLVLSCNHNEADTIEISYQDLKNKNTKNIEPISFEIILRLNECLYKYGFSFSSQIESEYLLKKESDVSEDWEVVFNRGKNNRFTEVNLHHIIENTNYNYFDYLPTIANNSNLFISLLIERQDKEEIQDSIIGIKDFLVWVKECIQFEYNGESMLIPKLIKDEKFKEYAIKFLKIVGINIIDIRLDSIHEKKSGIGTFDTNLLKRNLKGSAKIESNGQILHIVKDTNQTLKIYNKIHIYPNGEISEYEENPTVNRLLSIASCLYTHSTNEHNLPTTTILDDIDSLASHIKEFIFEKISICNAGQIIVTSLENINHAGKEIIRL